MPRRPTLAIGPVLPGWGSWGWVGEFLLKHLDGPFATTPFSAWDEPSADAVLVVKHAPPAGWAERVARRCAIVYCPIDYYAEAAHIPADAGWLRLCSGIAVHCHRLEPHFTPFAPTRYLDHPLGFAVSTRRTYRPTGDLLWTGVRSNLPALVAWVNSYGLPLPLHVLTNPETPGGTPEPAAFGFRPDRPVRVHEWTPERHRALAATARAALDVKGDDFRSRHKPPVKAIDFIASGLPVALNPDSSPAEHLAAYGLRVPSPADPDRWLSEAYWKETVRVGRRLTRELAPERVARKTRRLIEEALDRRPHPRTPPEIPMAAKPPTPDDRYRSALERAAAGDHAAARERLAALDAEDLSAGLRVLVRNDLAVLAAVLGDPAGAQSGFESVLALDPENETARANLEALGGPPPTPTPQAPPVPAPESSAVRVAVVSLLFNWPSTGGGNVHTAELTKFLAEAGYAVKHLYARHGPWGVGRVTEPTPFAAEAIPFSDAEWTADGVVAKFRAALDDFDADWVVLTDSWNTKPLLAVAAGDRPYILRLQALECLCPLNNVRLLPAAGGARQCTRHQLATPDECARCVRDRGHTSGDLHRAERGLAGVGTPEYRDALFAAFANAAAVLAVNPLTAAMVEPHAAAVRVVTAGMDPERFAVRPDGTPPRPPGRYRLLFAGLTREWMKGFHVLRAAAARLWETRQDFEVVATDAAPDDSHEPWVRYIGWQSQADLPAQMHAADLVVVPTVAQEALGRTAVEAMAAGRPVVASRLGGLPFTVADGATGLLCEPGDATDLAAKLAVLLDDPPLRERLGRAGRARFDERYAWPGVIARHYRPLLGDPARRPPRRRTAGAPVLVVVAHYAERPLDPLVHLLDSMARFPAGAAYEVRVVVNRDLADEICLPERHGGVEVIYRPNAGYNIGAWEAGWRRGPEYGGYLFLQGECQVVRAEWIAAFSAAAAGPGVGLVGECLSPDWDAPWDELAERFRGQTLPEHTVEGRPTDRVDCYRDFFRRRGISPGVRGDHLQSLILFARRAVLERVGGFPQCGGYGEAIAAEIGTSKKVQAAGLTVRQIEVEPFAYIEHPQWLHRRGRPVHGSILSGAGS